MDAEVVLPTCTFNVIVAVDEKWGIGLNGTIPWRKTPMGELDMKFFRNKTQHHIVIMGARTYAEIGQPLKDRINIVVTCNAVYYESTNPDISADPQIGKYSPVKDFASALALASIATRQSTGLNNYPDVWVIGGASIYSQAIVHPSCGNVYISMIPGDFNCDVFFPHNLLPKLHMNRKIYPKNSIISKVHLSHLIVRKYFRGANDAELKYLGLIGRIVKEPSRPNRTGIPTRSLFAQSLRFPLTRDNELIMPLITTKKVPFKLVATELQWFLGGNCTHTKQLVDANNHIWDDNTTPEFHAKRGLTKYIPGECGPIYGYQWRHWNREYIPGIPDGSMAELYMTNSADNPYGIDQLARVIETLKTDPYDRRMIVSAWNPEQLSKMVLPPCHWSFQFHCDPISDNFGTVYPDLCGWGEESEESEKSVSSLTPKKYFLNCVVNMRSADMCLGVPFNIASYALLTHMIARIVNMVPGELVIHMTDCHVYENHLEGAREQIQRTPYDFPAFEFGPEIPAEPTLELFATVNHNQFVVKEYISHPTIKYPMAI